MPKFVEMLTPWETEEVSCIAQFYKLLVQEILDRVEDGFVDLVKLKMKNTGDSGASALPPALSAQSEPECPRDDDNDWAYNLDFLWPLVFRRRQTRKHTTRSVLSISPRVVFWLCGNWYIYHCQLQLGLC